VVNVTIKQNIEKFLLCLLNFFGMNNLFIIQNEKKNRINLDFLDFGSVSQKMLG